MMFGHYRGVIRKRAESRLSNVLRDCTSEARIEDPVVSDNKNMVCFNIELHCTTNLVNPVKGAVRIINFHLPKTK